MEKDGRLEEEREVFMCCIVLACIVPGVFLFGNRMR